MLERAGIQRPPSIVIAATGDDEDNIVICQLAREKYGVEKVIARVNDPRNQVHFDLLGVSPTVCATSSIMALIEHEVPEHGLVHLLELPKENVEIVEVLIPPGRRLRRPSDRAPRPAGRVAADLGEAERSVRDRRRFDHAAARGPGPCDPPTGEGRRAATCPSGDLARPRSRRSSRCCCSAARPRAVTPTLQLVQAGSGFSNPVYVTSTSADPNAIYVVEQGGRVWRVVNGVTDPKPFLNISSKVRFARRAGPVLDRLLADLRDRPPFYAYYVSRKVRVTPSRLRRSPRAAGRRRGRTTARCSRRPSADVEW